MFVGSEEFKDAKFIAWLITITFMSHRIISCSILSVPCQCTVAVLMEHTLTSINTTIMFDNSDDSMGLKSQ